MWKVSPGGQNFHPTRMLGKLFLLFLIVPIVELALLVQLGRAVGFWPTLAVVIVTAMVGGWLAKREGTSTLRRLQDRLGRGQLPGDELLDGALILVSGALLLTPGVLTDVAGLLGLLPPTRRIARRFLLARFRRALERGTAGAFVPGRPFPPGRYETSLADEPDEPPRWR